MKKTVINHKSLSLINEQIPFIKNYEKKKKGKKIWMNKNNGTKIAGYLFNLQTKISIN